MSSCQQVFLHSAQVDSTFLVAEICVLNSIYIFFERLGDAYFVMHPGMYVTSAFVGRHAESRATRTIRVRRYHVG